MQNTFAIHKYSFKSVSPNFQLRRRALCMYMGFGLSGMRQALAANKRDGIFSVPQLPIIITNLIVTNSVGIVTRFCDCAEKGALFSPAAVDFHLFFVAEL